MGGSEIRRISNNIVELPVEIQKVRLTALLVLCAGLAACAGAAEDPVTPDTADATPETAAGEAVPGVDAEPGPEAASEPREEIDGPQQLRTVARPDEQLLVLQVRLRNYILSEGIFGYLDEGGLLLPLGEFMRVLEFPIGVDPPNGRADGWFLAENRVFALDLLNGEVVIEGRVRKFDRQLVELHEDDIYVDTRLLSRWFPVDIEFDLANLLVAVDSREPLLVEQRLEREKRLGVALSRRARQKAEYETVDVPYQWANWPLVNVSSQAGFRESASGVSEVTSRYNMLATADLMKMDSSLFVAGDEQQGVTQARFEMGRKDPAAGLLGPLRATSYTFGDIATPPIDLIARSTFGRGAQISSFPLQRSGEFDSTTLIGELPLGWEVELYRNEVLLDFRKSRTDGRYEFEDIPLRFGVNVLRLEFFGPQGQRREEVQRFLIGPGQAPAGEFYFRIAANQQQESLIPVPVSGATVAGDQQGEARAVSEIEYGVNQHLSLAAGASTLPLDGGRRDYGNVSARVGYGPVFGRLDFVGDSAGGKSGKLGLQFNLPLNFAIQMEHSEFRDFVSEEIIDDGDLTVRRSEMRMDGVIPGGSYFRVPFTIGGSRELSESGETESRLDNRLSISIKRISFSNNLDWLVVNGGANDYTTASGSFLTSGRVGRTSLRGGLQYNIEPDGDPTAATLAVEHLIDTDFSGRVGVEQSFVGNNTLTITAGLSRRFDVASLGLRGEWMDDGSWGTFMTLSFAFGREPRTGDWQMSSRQMANRGSASARVFLDNDYDGSYGEDDTLLEDVNFRSISGSGNRKTNADGVAFLTGLPAHRETDISLPGNSLEDPYWVPDADGFTIVPRPGSTAIVDFPIVVTGEIDGMVYLLEQDRQVEVADVNLQLVSADGKVVARTRSVFDGFFLFEFVRPGDYLVRVDPDQLSRLGMRSTGGRAASIKGNGTIVGGLTFVLTR